jgi:hypothetical protein
MSLAYNTLKGSDVTVTPIKLKYSNIIPSGSLTDNGIMFTVANNSSFDYYNPSFTDEFLLYRSVQGLYYMNFISGSTSGSAFEWSPQSTAANGTFDNDYRYFPTASNAQVVVISIPRAKFGENIARASFSISSSTYNIIDDGNGNLIDIAASSIHVGNLLYNQGIGVITNSNYLSSFTPTPACAVPRFKPFNASSASAVANWDAPGDPTLYYEYVVSTTSTEPVGSGTDVLADLGTLPISGLSPSTTYYFFLRSRCSVSSYSSWVSQTFTTTIERVPLRTGLIGEFYSSIGLVSSSNNVTRWNDQSGYSNDLYAVAPTNNLWFPQYTASYFKGQPGVSFTSSNYPYTSSTMRTAVTMSGLSGSTQLTVYYVARTFIGSGLVMEYSSGSNLGGGASYLTSTGSFAISTNGLSGASLSSKGNVGTNLASITKTIPTKSVFTHTIDFGLPTNELTFYIDNDSTGIVRAVNVNNSGSFDGYKLSVGGGNTDDRWLGANSIIPSILIYNVTHSNAERLQVYNYLTSSYLV